MGKLFFSLRAIQPVQYQDRNVGYIEVGEEIDHIFPMFKKVTDFDASIFLTKEFVTKKAVELKGGESGDFIMLDSSNKPGFNEQVQHLMVAELVHLGGYGKEI
jgi:hypothetical protein